MGVFLKSFKNYVEKQNLFGFDSNILLAVSGGVDSMVMVRLFHKAGIRFGIAHCNFALRAAASEKDAAFVEETAKNLGVPYFFKRFNTARFAKDNKISLQMAARELRYQWFDEILNANKFESLALAHHANDLAETFLINLLRGSGIAGLHGIRNKHERYIRPLLFASRQDIESYALKEKIVYRTDASNAETKYIRNKIRLKIIPELETINPATIEQINQTAHFLADIETIYNQHIEDLRKKHVKMSGASITIDTAIIIKSEGRTTLLYEFIKPFGFNTSQTSDIISSLNGISGKIFQSGTHILLTDRKKIIIESLKETCNGVFFINKSDAFLKTPNNTYLISYQAHTEDFTPIAPNTRTVFLDASRILYPITVRCWKKGDAFVPLGMNGRKSLSDFLIDNKVNIFDKERIEVFVSGTDIAWVAGMRPSNLFRVKATTQKIIKIEMIPIEK